MWKMSKIMIVRIRTSEICKEKKRVLLSTDSIQYQHRSCKFVYQGIFKVNQKRQTCPG